MSYSCIHALPTNLKPRLLAFQNHQAKYARPNTTQHVDAPKPLATTEARSMHTLNDASRRQCPQCTCIYLGAISNNPQNKSSIPASVLNQVQKASPLPRSYHHATDSPRTHPATIHMWWRLVLLSTPTPTNNAGKSRRSFYASRLRLAVPALAPGHTYNPNSNRCGSMETS